MSAYYDVDWRACENQESQIHESLTCSHHRPRRSSRVQTSPRCRHPSCSPCRPRHTFYGLSANGLCFNSSTRSWTQDSATFATEPSAALRRGKCGNMDTLCKDHIEREIATHPNVFGDDGLAPTPVVGILRCLGFAPPPCAVCGRRGRKEGSVKGPITYSHLRWNSQEVEETGCNGTREGFVERHQEPSMRTDESAYGVPGRNVLLLECWWGFV
jgi:hypothetical protein